MELEKKIITWKQYFANLLNSTIPLDPTENRTFHNAGCNENANIQKS